MRRDLGAKVFDLVECSVTSRGQSSDASKLVTPQIAGKVYFTPILPPSFES
jgi:hypothetical protein